MVAEVVTLHHELTERNVDLLITREFRPLADERLSFELLFDDSFVVVAGAQKPVVGARRSAPTELLDQKRGRPPPQKAFWWGAIEKRAAVGPYLYLTRGGVITRHRHGSM